MKKPFYKRLERKLNYIQGEQLSSLILNRINPFSDIDIKNMSREWAIEVCKIIDEFKNKTDVEKELQQKIMDEHAIIDLDSDNEI